MGSFPGLTTYQAVGAHVDSKERSVCVLELFFFVTWDSRLGYDK